MMYGLLIGLILFSLIVLHSNWTGAHDAAVTARMMGFFVFFPSAGALIGLIIRGS